LQSEAHIKAKNPPKKEKSKQNQKTVPNEISITTKKNQYQKKRKSKKAKTVD
jgi:hypothetical protein